MRRKMAFAGQKAMGSSFCRRPPAPLSGNDEEEQEEEEEEGEDEKQEEEEKEDEGKGWSE